MRNYILFFILLFTSVISSSQVHEIGISFGGTNFIGDIGRTTYIYPTKPGVGLFYKFNYNPRIAIRGTLSHLQIRANDAHSKEEYRQVKNKSFTNTINEIAAGIEFNFYNYKILSDSKKRSPYLLLELAAYTYEANHTIARSFAIPFGFGYKSRLFKNINFSLETKFRNSLQNNLETNQNRRVKNNENDWYAVTSFSLIYTFGRLPCYQNGF